jgi:hypothetical protein
MVPLGTKVYLINDPLKVASLDGELLLEVHAPVDAQGQTIEPELTEFGQLLDKDLHDTTALIDWDYVRTTLKLADGIPVAVGVESRSDDMPDETHPLGTTSPGSPARRSGCPRDRSAARPGCRAVIVIL